MSVVGNIFIFVKYYRFFSTNKTFKIFIFITYNSLVRYVRITIDTLDRWNDKLCIRVTLIQ